ncbi:MAG: MOFRL family protein, partial [Pirellulales bacterium]
APLCLLSGGETTVTLTEGHGKGGRNQEFVLAAALKLGRAGLRDTVVLSGGTDGEDGPTDAAGALVDAEVCRSAARLGLDAGDYLKRCDAYPFFTATGGLIKTGPTHTNVCDLRVVVVDRP